VCHIFGALAKFERNLIRERTYAGLAAARARGRRGGTRKKLGPVVQKSLGSGRLLARKQAAAVLQPDVDCKNAPDSDREVAMSEKADLRIDIEAAKALVYWKSLFADEVAACERRLAAESDQPEHVTCRITVRLRRLRHAYSRPRFWTEGHSLTTTRSHKPEQPTSPGTISADTDLWIRQFIKQFELHVLGAGHDLMPDASVSESQVATARAILATYLDSGLELESVMELFRRVAVEWRSVGASWSGVTR
jgi:Resolvase, N terminal domain